MSTKSKSQKEPFDLYEYATGFFNKCVKVSDQKAAMLASVPYDPMSNLYTTEVLGVCSAKTAILVNIAHCFDELTHSCKSHEHTLIKLSNQCMLLSAIIYKENTDEIDEFNFYEFRTKFYGKNMELVKKKNADYTGGKDPFANFDLSQKLNIGSPVIGFLTRMTDKLSRIITFINMGTYSVKSESVSDTLRDLSNYAMLLSAYLESKTRN